MRYFLKSIYILIIDVCVGYVLFINCKKLVNICPNGEIVWLPLGTMCIALIMANTIILVNQLIDKKDDE